MDDNRSRCVLVGAPSDPHFSAVASRLRDAFVVDVEALQAGSIALSADGALLHDRNGWAPVKDLRRGWIRRLAPPAWMLGTEAHTRRSSEQAAWLAMLVSLIRTSNVDWLTEIDRLLLAENKLLLAEAARSVSVPSPELVVACSPHAAASILGTDQLVAKPIGPSSFLSNGDYMSIPTSDVSGLLGDVLDPEPFLYQRRIKAVRHLRVVTVGTRAWCFGRSVVEDEPIDWRYLDAAQTGFRWMPFTEAEAGAIALADRLKVGYSSQDWIDDGDTIWVVDVNPGGQWLFLGERSHEITMALVTWLAGHR